MSGVSSQFSSSTANTQDNLAATYATTAVGSRYEATPQAVADGQLRGIQIDSKGRQVIVGPNADANTFLNLPVGVGGIYRTTLPTYTDGQATIFHMDSRGRLYVSSPGLPTALGQTTMSASMPVTIASDQSALPVKLQDGAGSSVVKGQTTKAGSLPVVIASDQDALSVKLQDGSGSSVTKGQTTKAGSLPVAIASDQDALSVKLQDGSGSAVSKGNAAMAASLPVTVASDQTPSTAFIRTATGSFTASSQTVTINPSGCNSIYVQLSGTFVGTFTMECSADSGVTYTSVSGWDSGNGSISTGGNVSGRQYVFPAFGNIMRARCSAYTSGTMVVTMVGGLGYNQAVYVSPVASFPIEGKTAAGSTGTGTQPVIAGSVFQTTPTTLTNGQTGFLQCDTSQNLLVREAGSIQANTPVYNDYGTTGVTTAAYVQMIASTTSAINSLEIWDTGGNALYFATGGAGSETNQFIIPPGGNGLIRFKIASGTRISVKAVAANSSTAGSFLIINPLT